MSGHLANAEPARNHADWCGWKRRRTLIGAPAAQVLPTASAEPVPTGALATQVLPPASTEPGFGGADAAAHIATRDDATASRGRDISFWTSDEKKEFVSQIVSQWIGKHEELLRGKLPTLLPAPMLERYVASADFRAALAAEFREPFGSAVEALIPDLCLPAGIDYDEVRTLVRRAVPDVVERVLSGWASPPAAPSASQRRRAVSFGSVSIVEYSVADGSSSIRPS